MTGRTELQKCKLKQWLSEKKRQCRKLIRKYRLHSLLFYFFRLGSGGSLLGFSGSKPEFCGIA